VSKIGQDAYGVNMFDLLFYFIERMKP